MAATLLAVAVGTGQAAIMYTYDLDSLVYMSTDIVEGEIVAKNGANRFGPVDVKISAVFKGALKEDQLIVVANTSLYRKPGGGLNASDLETGDRLFFFLVQTPNSRKGAGDKGSEYQPVGSGLRLVQTGNVLTFRQNGNPGPFVATLPRKGDTTESPTIDNFRKQLEQSMRIAPEYAAALEPGNAKPNGELLLKILGRLPKPSANSNDFQNKDRIGELAGERLAELGDPELLSRAQLLTRDYLILRMLERGFGTPKGRDYLLAKVNDPKLEMEVRLRSAKTLEWAGPIYKSSFVLKPGPGARIKRPADPNNSGYVTRIASAARDNVQSEELCICLLDCLRSFVMKSPPQSIDPQFSSDLQGALSILMELSTKTLPEKTRTALATIDPAGSREAYKLAGSQRPKEIICKMEGTANGRTLKLRYSYNAGSFDSEVTLHTSLILVHEVTKKRHELPQKLAVSGGRNMGASGTVTVPVDLPAGKYKVFAEVSDGNKVVATTEPFEADL